MCLIKCRMCILRQETWKNCCTNDVSAMLIIISVAQILYVLWKNDVCAMEQMTYVHNFLKKLTYLRFLVQEQRKFSEFWNPSEISPWKGEYGRKNLGRKAFFDQFKSLFAHFENLYYEDIFPYFVTRTITWPFQQVLAESRSIFCCRDVAIWSWNRKTTK